MHAPPQSSLLSTQKYARSLSKWCLVGSELIVNIASARRYTRYFSYTGIRCITTLLFPFPSIPLPSRSRHSSFNVYPLLYTYHSIHTRFYDNNLLVSLLVSCAILLNVLWSFDSKHMSVQQLTYRKQNENIKTDHQQNPNKSFNIANKSQTLRWYSITYHSAPYLSSNLRWKPKK